MSALCELCFSPDIVPPLLAYYARCARDLPWRASNAPYSVLVSEIMLQQTRAEAVRPYYLRFMAELPDFGRLADCSTEKLLKLWEGLGYYRRARALQAAARVVMKDYNGVFPGEYQQIRALPGVGDYTAGAVSSICFGLKEPAVDGNVLRIGARLTGCAACVGEEKVKRAFREALRSIYPEAAGDFTQALMELGACVCTPRAPRCGECPVWEFCIAYREHTQALLPLRAPKKPRREETRTVLLLRCDESIALAKRAPKGLLGGLWELPNVEGTLSAQEALTLAQDWGAQPLAIERTLLHTHKFTHIQWSMTCHVLRCAARPARFVWATEQERARDYALPSAFKWCVEADI